MAIGQGPSRWEDALTLAKSYYYRHAGRLSRDLKSSLSPATLKRLHRRQPIRHFLIAARQLALLVGLPIVIYHFPNPWIWVPASLLLGFVIFSFPVLLHEVVHKSIFRRDHKSLYTWLGRLYATVSGLSAAQFTRWHLDHHGQLGSAELDPKRAYLSPKRNARWYKLLYCTPALFPIYFSAAKKAQNSYPEALRRRIRKERLATTVFHLGVIACFGYLSPLFALKAAIIPIFFVFPVAFTINRLGQHYVIDPDNVANWSTLIRPNPIWNFLFLFSSYHLEHHYYPAVPFYQLKALQRELEPFFRQQGIPSYNYSRLLKTWFVDNHQPHSAPARRVVSEAVQS